MAWDVDVTLLLDMLNISYSKNVHAWSLDGKIVAFCLGMTELCPSVQCPPSIAMPTYDIMNSGYQARWRLNRLQQLEVSSVL